jgi:hypothetical protein
MGIRNRSFLTLRNTRSQANIENLSLETHTTGVISIIDVLKGRFKNRSPKNGFVY